MLIAAFALLLAQTETPAPPTPPALDRFGQCVASIEANADHAYEEAMAWANETSELSAFRCAAMALVEMGRREQGAQKPRARPREPARRSGVPRGQAVSACCERPS